MDKNEVIILSSDEETDNDNQFNKKIEFPTVIKINKQNKIQRNGIIKTHCAHDELSSKQKLQSIETSVIQTEKSPEIVDLVDIVERSPEEESKSCESLNELKDDKTKNNSSFEMFKVIISRNLNKEQCAEISSKKDEEVERTNERTNAETNEVLKADNVHNEKTSVCSVERENVKESQKIVENTQPVSDSELKEDFESNSILFNEFVELCGSLEKNPNDKKRLIKKLEKRHLETDPDYARSQNFKDLIEKSKNKLNKNNLYIIAKEVTDELSLRKKINIETGNSNLEDGNDQRTAEEQENEDCNLKNKKKIKIINKIVKRLDKMGKKIRELEEAEVELSDEEDSSYIRLQRYRERFCQIYKKLSDLTKDLGVVDPVHNQKIYFSGSKYPAIDKCIEKWLNKTKRFPDFNDIMKLLESQSTALELSTNKEALRVLATDIFQQVGVMLQRRRKYDLWDSFCGFLENSIDPAKTDPELDKVLLKNFETSVKKEQEIFNYYAEKQERERLKPEEVPDDEANHSVESGKEDEEEIEDIENSINERLDCVIEEEVKENDESLENVDWDGGGKSKTPLKDANPNDSTEGKISMEIKESKNNFKNCKSLKWRRENRTKSKSGNSEESGLEEDNQTYMEEDKSEEDSDIEFISGESMEVDKSRCSITVRPSTKDEKQLKRELNENNENLLTKKRKIESLPSKKLEEGIQVLKISPRKDFIGKKKDDVFEVHCCQIEQNFDIFGDYDDFNERRSDWQKGKVFRDLTNINRLMDSKERKKLWPFSQSFYLWGIRGCEKGSWKKRLTIGCNLAGLKNIKCALSQEEDKSGKKLNGDSGDSEERDVQNNSESGGDEGSNFYGGSGSDEDNNENDENGKKNGKTGSDWEEEKEEDEGEEKEEENEEQMEGDSTPHSNEEESESIKEKEFTCIVRNETEMSTTLKEDVEMEQNENGDAVEKLERDENEPESEENSEKPYCDSEEEENLKSPKNADEKTEIENKMTETEENKSKMITKSEDHFETENDNRILTSSGENSCEAENDNKTLTNSEESSSEVENDNRRITKSEENSCEAETEEMPTKSEENSCEAETERMPTKSEENSCQAETERMPTKSEENSCEAETEGMPTKSEENEASSEVENDNKINTKSEENSCEIECDKMQAKSEENSSEAENNNRMITRNEENSCESETDRIRAKNKENSCEVVNDCNELQKEESADLETKEEEINAEKLESNTEDNLENEKPIDSSIKPKETNAEENLLNEKSKVIAEEDPQVQEKETESEEIEINENASEKCEEAEEKLKTDDYEESEDNEYKSETVVSENETNIAYDNPDFDESDVTMCEKINEYSEYDSADDAYESDYYLKSRLEPDIVISEAAGTFEGFEEVNENLKRSSQEEESDEYREEMNFKKARKSREVADCEYKMNRDRIPNRTEYVQDKKDRVTIMRVRPSEEMLDKDVSNRNQFWRRDISFAFPRNLSMPDGRKMTSLELAARSMRKRNKSTSDEERVKQFLLHSPSSISITPPKKLSLSKPPSQAALQALATLRNLKGISTTRVRRPRSEDDVVVIGESCHRQAEHVRRRDVPVISNVTSMQPRTPKIVTVQGNAPGFGHSNHPRYNRMMNNGQPASNLSSIRISNVWGNLPDSFYQSMQNSDAVTPSCSSRPTNPPASNVARKKTAKKPVEYVVLD